MKKIMFGAMALISLSVAASAALTSSIPGITVTESSCDDGYIITSTREGVSKTVEYDSCLSEGIVVKDGSGEVVDAGPVSLAETVNINGVDVYFAAGYTTPTVAADDTCAGGYNNTSNTINCGELSLGSLSDGYLNLTSAEGDMNFWFDRLANVDGLANLTSAGGALNFFTNYLTNVDGLANLTSVGDSLSLSANNLINVDGLSSLTSVGSSLYLNGNLNLQDLSGLNNLESLGSLLYLDARDYAVKLDANSYICQNFATKVKLSSGAAYPTKSDICYE